MNLCKIVPIGISKKQLTKIGWIGTSNCVVGKAIVECKDDDLQNRSKTITRFVEVHTPEIIEIILNMTKRCLRAAAWMKQVFCSRLLDSVDRFAKD